MKYKDFIQRKITILFAAANHDLSPVIFFNKQQDGYIIYSATISCEYLNRYNRDNISQQFFYSTTKGYIE